MRPGAFRRRPEYAVFCWTYGWLMIGSVILQLVWWKHSKRMPQLRRWVDGSISVRWLHWEGVILRPGFCPALSRTKN